MIKKYETPKVGDKFGLWTVIGKEEIKINKIRRILCECSCNKKTQKLVIIASLYNENNSSKDCGCRRINNLKPLPPKHNMTKTKFYSKYASIKERCYNPNCKEYKNYGARGIKLGEDWDDFLKFKEDMYESYLQHSNKFSEKDTTLERIDVNGNYTFDNCKWATMKEQNNNKRDNIILNYRGENYTLQQLSEKLGIFHGTLRSRLNRGWTLEEATSGKRFDPKCIVIEVNNKQISLYNYVESLGYNGHTAVSYVSRYNITPEEAVERLRNSKRLNNTLYCTYKGETKTVKEWSIILNLNYRNVLNRIYRYNWSELEALEFVSRKIGESNGHTNP